MGCLFENDIYFMLKKADLVNSNRDHLHPKKVYLTKNKVVGFGLEVE